MRQDKLEEVKKHVPTIVDYPSEIEAVENFFAAKDLDSEATTVVFWNHLITLFERIDEGEQNDLDLSDADELSKEAQALTKEFEQHMQTQRAFQLTAFENYLMQIHFEQISKGE